MLAYGRRNVSEGIDVNKINSSKKNVIVFGNIEIEKRTFHYRQNLILLEDSDKIQVSGMVSSGEENYHRFTDYNDDDYKIKPLRLVRADKLLKKYTDIWIKVINSITKNLIVDLSLLKDI